MNGQTRGNGLTGRGAGRLAGAVGLLLALVLIAGGVHLRLIVHNKYNSQLA